MKKKSDAFGTDRMREEDQKQNLDSRKEQTKGKKEGW
jgi:hypothetical protein